ncbi:MAG: FAD-binding oxidoreductase [Pyrinomonadaceae bacterium]
MHVSSIEEAREVLHAARSENWRVGIQGAGGWNHPDAHRGVSVMLKTTNMSQLIEHEPADLVATAQSGLTLTTFNRALGRANQWLPLDPPGNESVTLGGVVATGLAGAQAFGYGSPRGHVIGMRVLLADGRLIKAGGRVVKNVAGYDICKLLVGSYGTLGLITELTFKLRPRPAREATVVLIGERTTAPLYEAARAILARQLLPVAVEMLSPLAAAQVSAHAESEQYALLVRFAGTTQAVVAQSDSLCDIASSITGIKSISVNDNDSQLWLDVAALSLGHPQALVWRGSVKSSSLPDVIASLYETDSPQGIMWHAGLGDNRLRVILNEPDQAAQQQQVEQSRRVLQKHAGSLIVEAMPAKASPLSVWGDAGTTQALMKRIKQQLDPENTFPTCGFTE